MKMRPVYFFGAWLVLNLLQAAFTELTSDEGYYWYYSRSLEWGYYDHPPLVALVVKLGTAFLPGELGVRAVNVVLNALSVLLALRLAQPTLSQSTRAYLLVLCLPLLNYLAFLVFPDGPLLFFLALFLTGYRRFLDKEDLVATVFIGCSAALMLYAKYHGALVIGLTVLSNVRLLRSWRFWAAMGLATALFLPHLAWQYSHDFPTLQYHLQGRTGALTTRYLLEYVSQQLPVFGLGLIFVPFLVKATDRFERALRFLAVGTFVFFLFTATKAFVHFHWTSIALVPALVLGARFYANGQHSTLFRYTVLPMGVAMILLRFYLVIPISGFNHTNVDYYHGRKFWAQDIHAVAGNRPVLFSDNFRESSLYEFYSGGPGLALQSGEKRRSQYELWNAEAQVQGKEVLLVRDSAFAGSSELHTRMGKTVHTLLVKDFASYYDLPMNVSFPATVFGGEVVPVSVSVSNPRKVTVTFGTGDFARGPRLFFVIQRDGIEVHRGEVDVFPEETSLPAGGQRDFRASVHVPSLPEGDGWSVRFGVRYEPLLDSYNSAPIKFRVSLPPTLAH